MNVTQPDLSVPQHSLAIQRLTALWAFAESGLGGVLHAFQIPFTGLVIGGFAVIIITLIAKFSDHHYQQILKSFLIVLIVKAMVSPHTPVPAYLAISFQAIMGYGLFSLFKVNFLSIFLLSILAMMESAIQKLLILTFFFGQSLWKAADGLADFITQQLGLQQWNGSYWLIVLYLLIYFIGGIATAWIAYKTIRQLSFTPELPEISLLVINDANENNKTSKTKFWAGILLMLIISALLFFFSPENSSGWIAVIKTISWTISAILIWYLILAPLLTRFIINLLKKKESRYQKEVTETMSVFPYIKKLSILAWQQSRKYRGLKRITLFLSLLLHWALTYSDITFHNKTT